MAEKDVTARTVKNIKITIGADSYSKHVNAFTVEPKIDVETWQGGTPDAVISDAAISAYTASCTLVHDYQNPDSLYNFLLAHPLEAATIDYLPDADGDFTAHVDVTLVPPTTGGPIGKFHTSTIQMPASTPTYDLPS